MKNTIMKNDINLTIKALNKNNIDAFFAENREKLKEIIKTLVPNNSKVSWGGSVTLVELGILDMLKNEGYITYDRATANNNEELKNIYMKNHICDAYFTSSNAVTQDGELYNVDGNGNRVAAINFGAEKVIFIVGYNKIVKNLNEAVYRVKTIAAPKNTVRLNISTPCNKTGECVAKNESMTKGCSSVNRICCEYSVLGYQRNKRINVIFVNEHLGY